jgi:hypothetical protein
MPNWFYGNVRLSGNSQEKLLPFKEYFSKYEEGPYGEFVIINQEKGFAETFLPLPGGKWNYANAVDLWGVKWDLKITQIINENPDEIQFSFESAWNMPREMFARIEKKYGVIIECVGNEEQECGFEKYHNGKYISLMDEELDTYLDAEYPEENYKHMQEDDQRHFRDDIFCDALSEWADKVDMSEGTAVLIEF